MKLASGAVVKPGHTPEAEHGTHFDDGEPAKPGAQPIQAELSFERTSGASHSSAAQSFLDRGSAVAPYLVCWLPESHV